MQSLISWSLIVLGVGCLLVATVKNGWRWAWDGEAVVWATVAVGLLILAAVVDPSLRSAR